MCEAGSTCRVNLKCWDGDEDGVMRQGWRSQLFRGDEAVGEVCLLDRAEPGEAVDAPVIPTVTPGMVLREFRRLSWPASELVIQPPDQRTLVNLDTNFFTENTEPVTRTVRLLGLRVTIEARPSSYTWRFDERGAGVTTREAGSPYPDLEVTHAYTEAARVWPRVDTTYSGRFRVGGGDWVEIPETLTVPGEPVGLEVVEARSVLVGAD